MTALADLDLVAITDPSAEPMDFRTEDGDPFTDLDRRTIANLSIPRNVYDLQHRLRTDPNTPTRDEHAVYDHLLALEGRGLATNLGSHTDMAKLAHMVERHPMALTMPDDKAAIFADRLSRPERAWRVDGDVWMLTYAGLDTIQAPAANAPGPMTPSQVQAAVDREFQRVVVGWKPGDPLGMYLLEREYAAWAVAVADACERVWGARPRVHMPIAGGASGWSDDYEVDILDQENQKTAIGAVVDPWYMALSILALTDADTGTTVGDGTHVPTYTGWARKSVAGSDMAAAAAGSAANTSAIQFAACTSGTSTILAFANCATLAASGLLRKWGDCASTVISTTQTPAQFAIGAYVTTAT